MNHNYGKYVEVKANRRKVHKYLGMTFDFTGKSRVKIYMYDYIERMVNGYPTKIFKSDTALTSSGNKLFEKGNRKILGKENNLRVAYFSSKRDLCGQER